MATGPAGAPILSRSAHQRTDHPAKVHSVSTARSMDRSARHARYRLALFNSIYEESEQLRAHAIDSIVGIVRTWVQQLLTARAGCPKCAAVGGATGTVGGIGGGSLPTPTADGDDCCTGVDSSRSPGSGGNNCACQSAAEACRETRDLLGANLLVILRMSHNCPFDDVRRRFAALLAECRDAGVPIPRPSHNSPSFFISAERVVQIGGQSDLTTRLMTSSFILNGRFSHVYRLMIYFPSFMETHVRTYNQIMRHQGPLPRHWRNYIAIMAAAQHSCQYLVSLQSTEFLQNGGDPGWLSGLAGAPAKLRALSTLNTVMSHQPWRLSRKHIEVLLRGDGDNWSKSELMQAIVVLATFHSLSSFVMGCGVVPEIDMPGGTRDDDTLANSSDALFTSLDHRHGIESALATPTATSPSSMPSAAATAALHDDEPLLVDHTAQLIHRLKDQDAAANSHSFTDQAEVFANCEEQETFLLRNGSSPSSPAMTANASSLPTASKNCQPSGSNIVAEDLARFLSENELTHVDFDYKSTEYSVFRLQDYNWEEHCCPLISKFLPDTGELIDDEFNTILNLTDYSLFNTREQDDAGNVDTWPFRQAIWYYVLRLSGLSHDDYNYHEVNIYLNKRIKQYIKKVACSPERIVPADFHRMGFTFRPDEKCQINLLASEARKCAELVYALSALTKCDR